MSGNGTFWNDLLPLRWYWSLLILLIFGGVCIAIGYTSFDNQIGAAIEAGCLAMLGLVLARGFIALLLHVAPPQDTAAGRNASALILLGFMFFPPIILIEIVVWICKRRFFSSRIGLLTIATVVGAFTGFMDGGRQIHRASGLFPFPLDVTWGLSGTCNGAFLHCYNLIDTTYQDSEHGPRDDTHQYEKGFAFEENPVFTQGSVMSNYQAKERMFSHELLHAYQNRFWGPLYTLSAVMWMATALLPGLLVGLVVGAGGDGVRLWSYENNPHETLAYVLGGSRNTKDREEAEELMLWPASVWIMASTVFYLHMVLFLTRVISTVWVRGQVFSPWNAFEFVRCIAPLFVAAGNLTIWMAILGTKAGAVYGGILAVIGWLACFPPALGDKVTASVVMRIYKIMLAWSSLTMPLCWPGHALGLLAFMREVWSGRTSFDARTMNVRVVGGWLGRRTARGVTLGMFSFHNPERLTTSTLLHQSGHVLNHAAFGFFHLVFQFICLGNRHTMWERLAESHVPRGNRKTDAYDQDEDWPRLRQWGPGATSY